MDGKIDGKVMMTGIAMLALAIDATRSIPGETFEAKRRAVWEAIALADSSIAQEFVDFALERSRE